MKPIYKAPVIDQLKDIKRACEIALDMLDVMPMRNITAEDMKREGLSEGEMALCDWIIRPRFIELSKAELEEAGLKPEALTQEDRPVWLRFDGERKWKNFDGWWDSLMPHATLYRMVGNYAIDKDLAQMIWNAATTTYAL